MSAQEIAGALKEEYGAKFGHFLITTHPRDVPGRWLGRVPISRMPRKERDKKY